jgi:endonuclease YncB( thermonuclease family)
LTAPAYTYRAQAVGVHDGDTFTARVDLGFHIRIDIHVRVRDVDTPELPTKAKPSPAGTAAYEFLRKLLMPTPYAEENPAFIVRSYKDQRSFERWVCDVELWDGSDLAGTIIVNGHGVRV